MAIREDEKVADAKTLAEHFSNSIFFSFPLDMAGECHLELEQLEEALKHFEKAVGKDPHNATYYHNRALVKSRLDKLEEAIVDYTKVVNNPPDNDLHYKAVFHRGICLRKLGRLDDSVTDLKKAVELKPESDSAHNNLGLSYFEREDFEEALKEF